MLVKVKKLCQAHVECGGNIVTRQVLTKVMEWRTGVPGSVPDIPHYAHARDGVANVRVSQVTEWPLWIRL